MWFWFPFLGDYETDTFSPDEVFGNPTIASYVATSTDLLLFFFFFFFHSTLFLALESCLAAVIRLGGTTYMLLFPHHCQLQMCHFEDVDYGRSWELSR